MYTCGWVVIASVRLADVMDSNVSGVKCLICSVAFFLICSSDGYLEGPIS